MTYSCGTKAAGIVIGVVDVYVHRDGLGGAEHVCGLELQDDAGRQVTAGIYVIVNIEADGRGWAVIPDRYKHLGLVMLRLLEGIFISFG